MLDEKDLQAIQGLLEHSESRMMARMDRLDARIDQLDTRVDQLGEDIKATESRIMAYIESDILPRFDILAEGHTLLRETLAPKSRVEELEEEVAFLKPLVMSMLTDIDKLKKAQ
ncbi:MAG: hypothetical protein HDT14_08305 [Oscillibacter sp.]|nr:hypothetical protein [Oscillibacter sp.]